MPHEIIFHNFATSPFSEKVRLVFGMKKLAWRSVEIPSMLPKPDFVPLTGGYRKTPAMQIGADIFCDTQIIIRELERRFPNPERLSARQGTSLRSRILDGQAIFHGERADHLRRNRRHGAGGVQERPRSNVGRQAFSTEGMKAVAPFMRDQWRAHAAFIADQLADGPRLPARRRAHHRRSALPYELPGS